MIRGIIGFIILLSLLEVVTRAGLVHPYYLPPATHVVARAARLSSDMAFLAHIGATAYATTVGLGLTAILGIPLGIVLGSSKLAYKASSAIIEFVRPIPAVMLIPPMILIFGTGSSMKIALVVFGAIWPVLFNTIYGIHSVDPIAKETARIFGRGGLRLLLDVSLPSAVPFIYTGVRIAAAIALLLTISGEMLSGGQLGLGIWLMLMGQTGRAPALVFAGTVWAGILGWLLNALLMGVQRRFVGWHTQRLEGK